jgi:hypothetical protein
MSSNHRYAHAALAIIYGGSAAILALESAFAHAACALAAAAIYAAMCHRPPNGDKHN